MMLYLEYEIYKTRFFVVQKMFDDALMEKERLFSKTQQNAIAYDRNVVQTSPNGNVLDNYVIALEEKKIDKTIEHYRQMLVDRERLLTLKEKELRKSTDIYDRVYVLKYMDGNGINKIARSLNYSKSQVYRILNQIGKRCDKMRKNT